MTAERVAMIRTRLYEALTPSLVEIVDDSHKHVGHAGAQTGAGHFKVTLVTAAFTGKSLLQRHRMVYDALESALHSDIHALSIRAYTPDEFTALTPKE